jgi:propionyl-CoA synthetase
VTGKRERWTYKELLEEVEVFAGVLREEGVGRGDVVLVYSMLPLLSVVSYAFLDSTYLSQDSHPDAIIIMIMITS